MTSSMKAYVAGSKKGALAALLTGATWIYLVFLGGLPPYGWLIIIAAAIIMTILMAPPFFKYGWRALVSSWVSFIVIASILLYVIHQFLAIA